MTDLNKALSQLKKLYSDAGLGPLEYVIRNHTSWTAMKQRPTRFADSKNTPGVDYASREALPKEFEASVKRNEKLLEKLANGTETAV